MKLNAVLYLLGLCSITSATTTLTPYTLENAAHIFNAIHSSMRQWGSSLNHNGMSFFLASLKEGIQLYHGSSQPDIVSGTEWVAFDPEHAMVFARFGNGPRQPEPNYYQYGSGLQQHFHTPDHQKVKAGWLHTYVTTKTLNLLYLDGMSAAKSKVGTLDSQDHLLLNDTIEGGVLQEYARAHALCEMNRQHWDNKIDGFIRMAARFEIILCSFEAAIKPLRVTRVLGAPQTSRSYNKTHVSVQDVAHRSTTASVATMADSPYRTIASRCDDAASQQVVVYYDHFVTAYAHLLHLYTHSEDLPRALPRLTQVPQNNLEPIRSSVRELLRHHTGNTALIDWRGVADMIVQRYSAIISFLTSGNPDATESLHAELDSLMAQFIDFDHRNKELEVERCEKQFIPTNAAHDSVPYQAVRAVSHHICSTISILSNMTDHGDMMIQKLKDLKSYLNWTSWKQCHGCDDNEFCQIPIWPRGSIDDFHHPRCVKFANAYVGSDGYWGEVWR